MSPVAPFPTPTSIVVVRHRMRGDVLLCSAVIRGLNIRYPDVPIFVRTEYPECFQGNPRVQAAGMTTCGPREAKIMNADAVFFEKMPGWHLIDGFAGPCGFERGTCPKTTEMFVDHESLMWAAKMTAKLPKDYVIMSPGPGAWEGRNWPESYWYELCRQVMEVQPVVLVGVDKRYRLPSTLDLRQQTRNFMQLAALVERAKVFVGIDSFPCHVAGAVKTPRVVLFGVTQPDLILCDAPNTISVCSHPGHPFTGARHKVASMTKINLGHPPNNPMDTIPVEAALAAVFKLL